MSHDLTDLALELPTIEEKQTVIAFDQVISPLSRGEFLINFWGKSFVRLTGYKGRFEPLLTWDDLNSILEHEQLEPPRLRLMRDGNPVDPSRFCALQNGIRRLRPASLVSCLSEGATLILDGVEGLASSVREFAGACEEALHAWTVVNLYAGWRTQKGFNLHWDDQDTMILQASGRKNWKVYRPTRLHPLRGEVNETPQPADDPVWEGILEDGDMIYMPRGWWHVAFPLDEPSLHLTVTIVPANGTDLLRWFTDELKQHAEVRMNVPDPASVTERKQYVSRIRELMLEFWNDDVLDRFLARWNAIPLRPQIELPFSPVNCRAPITMETRIRLATVSQLSFRSETGDIVSFHANGIRWECPRALVPSLALLRNTASHSIRELCAHLPDPTAAPGLSAFLAGLALGGTVWIMPHESSSNNDQSSV